MTIVTYTVLLVFTHVACFYFGVKTHKFILRRKKEILEREKKRRKRLHKLAQKAILLRRVERRQKLKAMKSKPDKTVDRQS